MDNLWAPHTHRFNMSRSRLLIQFDLAAKRLRFQEVRETDNRHFLKVTFIRVDMGKYIRILAAPSL